jgi:CheY-like chemotaxis protein
VRLCYFCRVAEWVVVVDDDEAVREAIGEVLTEDGFQVRLARDGDEALRVLHEVPRPCVALIDLVMPRIDGWQLVRAIQGDASLGDIPLIVSSAGREDPPAGCVGVLQKPFDNSALGDAVRAALATISR